MKTAIIYYSFEGNSAYIADIIKSALEADAFEIKTSDTKKRKGFAKYFWGGMQAVTRKKPELQPLSVDVDAYDLIILGTPVWAGSPAPAFASFLSGTRISGKKIALFCCHAGGKGKIFEKMKDLLFGNAFAGEMDFVNPSKGNPADLRKKITEWAGTFK